MSEGLTSVATGQEPRRAVDVIERARNGSPPWRDAPFAVRARALRGFAETVVDRLESPLGRAIATRWLETVREVRARASGERLVLEPHVGPAAPAGMTRRGVWTKRPGIALLVCAVDATPLGIASAIGAAYAVGVPSVPCILPDAPPALLAVVEHLVGIVDDGIAPATTDCAAAIALASAGDVVVVLGTSDESTAAVIGAAQRRGVTVVADSSHRQLLLLGPDAHAETPLWAALAGYIQHEETPLITSVLVPTAIVSDVASLPWPSTFDVRHIAGYDSPHEVVTRTARLAPTQTVVFSGDPSLLETIASNAAGFGSHVVVASDAITVDDLVRESDRARVPHAASDPFTYLAYSEFTATPQQLTDATGAWIPGAATPQLPTHPFRLTFGELAVGTTIATKSRVITLEDIEHFAHFTGDTFYAHMDEAAAAANPLFGTRVAHGYLIIAFAAGLFTDSPPGPVLANYGLDGLRFVKPVKPGDAISARVTVKEKTPRTPVYGEVRWDVELRNQHHEPIAHYELLTMNATGEQS